MQSAVLSGIGKFEIIQVPEPRVSKGEVLVSLAATGICGSDIHYYATGRIGSQECVFPQALGHECSGIVAKAFSKSKFKEGDRVAIEPGRPCLACEHCRSGFFNRCPHVRFLGSPGQPGGFAEFAIIAEEQLEPLPASLSFDEGVLCEPLGIALHAAGLVKPAPGESIAIFGAGPIGLLTLAAARLAGAGETFIIDKLDYRLQTAKRLYPADHCTNPNKTNPVEFIKNKTRGRGVDICFEAAGAPETFNACVEAVRIGGRVAFLGIPEVESISLNPHAMRRKELAILNVRRSNNTLKKSIDLVAGGAISLQGLATHHFPLLSINNAFETVQNYADGVLKAVVNPRPA